MGRGYTPLTREEREYFVDMYRAGVPFEKIGREFGVSHQTARRWARVRFSLPVIPRHRKTRARREREDEIDAVEAMRESLPLNHVTVRPARRRPGDGGQWWQLI